MNIFNKAIITAITTLSFVSNAQAFGPRRSAIADTTSSCISTITFSNGSPGSALVATQVVEKQNTAVPVVNASVVVSSGEREQTDNSGVAFVFALDAETITISVTGFEQVSGVVPRNKKEAAVYLCKNEAATSQSSIRSSNRASNVRASIATKKY